MNSSALRYMRIRRLISYLLIAGSFILFLIWVVMFILVLSCPNFRTILGDQIGAAVLTAIGACIGYLFIKAFEEYQNARNSALALTSDISSIMSIIEKAGIAQHFMLQFASPQRQFLWADVAREENYFTVFEAQVGNLGALREPKMVADVTRFYTFLKASRDATSPLLGATKGDGQPATMPQTGKAAEEKSEDPDVRNHRIRMVSVSVCEILEATFIAGKKVIETYEKTYEPEETLSNNADQTLEDIHDFLTFWSNFWVNNHGKYSEEGSSVLDNEIKNNSFFQKLRTRYFDAFGDRLIADRQA